MDLIANIASILGFVISLISLFLVTKIHFKISQNINVNVEKSNNKQESFGINNKQKMNVK
jgi:hypothetical protein